jgi:predicted nucleic acid-binding protein
MAVSYAAISCRCKLISILDRQDCTPLDHSDIATHIVDDNNIAHMKTTFEISDPLLREARKVAAREGTTLRALVELGLRRVLAEKRRTSHDARVAAPCHQHNVRELWSADRDFGRFAGLTVVNPLTR